MRRQEREEHISCHGDSKKLLTTVTPTAATFSKAAPADVAVTVSTPSGVTLAKVTTGDTTVTKTGNYTYSASVLTLKSALLSAQETGDIVYTLHMTNGDTANITVTVAE